MGSGRFSGDDWKSYATTSSYDTKSTHEIFSKREIDKDLSPFGVKIRESRDSKDNPNSNAIIVGLDVTGSMSMVLDSMARKGLPALMTNIYDRKPVTDPHVLCAAIGDVEAGDQAPFQITQFEADIRIAQQLEKLYLEGGGGGNLYESYALAWYFAAMHTSIDCFEKRGKKGYLFTVGDESPTPYLKKGDIEKVFGDKIQSDLKIDQLLTMVSRQWEVFHLIVEEGSNGKYPETHKKWGDVLGQRALKLSDHTKLAEVVVSTIQVCEGADHKTVSDSWDGTTSVVVSKAIKDISKSSSTGGLVTL